MKKTLIKFNQYKYAILILLATAGAIVNFGFGCARDLPAELSSASNGAALNIVAQEITLSGDGIVNLSGSPLTGAFAVATSNFGGAGQITVSTHTGGTVLPLNIAICQTNTATGTCTSAVASSLDTTITSNGTASFAIFLNAMGVILLDTPNHRVYVTFTDASGVVRASTSVAVQTL